ncbi:MAG TPA: xylulokinase [Aggregatilineales bacterium]|nr:xylulokinase [Aggregatilineales bacterium]
MYYVGIDVSTTASKALAIDEKGNLAASASYPHPISTPRPLWSEQNPLDWWDAVCRALRDITAKIPADQIAAVGLTGQMHGLTTLDKDNQPVRPAILWNDQRSGAECAAITRKIGAEWLYSHIGTQMLTGFTAPKLAWLREHEPDAYGRIEKFLLPKDYIRFRMSGAFVTDVADGSGTALMDIARRTWSEQMIAALDLPRQWLPELCESPEVCAHVNSEGAAATGLKVGTPIVGGAGDQPAQAIGSGITRAGETSLTVGTSGVVFTAADRYAPEPDGRLQTYCHAIPGVWFYMGVMLSAAGSLRWLHDELAPDKSYEQLSELAASVPRGSGGLLFSPYLTGERHPHPDPLARGGFIGLTARQGLPHLVRAVMEGVAFGMDDNLALLRAQGTHPKSAAVSGGAANSPVWRELLAEITELPLYTVNSTEGAAFGAAILGAVGVGAWRDVPSACSALIRKVDEITPTSAGMTFYARLHEVFDVVYPTLRSLSHTLGTFEAGK